MSTVDSHPTRKDGNGTSRIGFAIRGAPQNEWTVEQPQLPLTETSCQAMSQRIIFYAHKCSPGLNTDPSSVKKPGRTVYARAYKKNKQADPAHVLLQIFNVRTGRPIDLPFPWCTDISNSPRCPCRCGGDISSMAGAADQKRKGFRTPPRSTDAFNLFTFRIDNGHPRLWRSLHDGSRPISETGTSLWSIQWCVAAIPIAPNSDDFLCHR